MSNPNDNIANRSHHSAKDIDRIPLDGSWVLVKSDSLTEEELSLKSYEKVVSLSGTAHPIQANEEVVVASPLLKVPDVAVLLSMSKSKVHELVSAGEIPSIRIGKCVRVRQQDLDAFIDGRLAGVSNGSSFEKRNSHG